MTKDISIHQVKELKAELEESISALLIQFKNETGILITEINIKTISIGSMNPTGIDATILSEVKCKAEL